MLSNSASSAVTSPSISGSGEVLSSLATEIFALEPIFTPDLLSTMRSESRNRSTNRSGSRRLSSTWAESSIGFDVRGERRPVELDDESGTGRHLPITPPAPGVRPPSAP